MQNMGSPGIDLDMNLLSSPCAESPAMQGWSGDGGSSRNNNANRNGARAYDEISHAENIRMPSRSDRDSSLAVSGHSESMTQATTSVNVLSSHGTQNEFSTQQHAEGDTTIETEDCTESGQNSMEDYDGMTLLAESWREELNMMNVKNSILLDDLVKVGADV